MASSVPFAKSPVADVFRAPKRISITIPYALYAGLLAASDQQGRSLSNYAAHLLEVSMLQRGSHGLPFHQG